MRVQGQNLSFSYETRPIFSNVNLEIATGQVSTFIGPNGAGKSTLIRCLCNLYQPDTGFVYLGEHEISMLPAKERARIMGYVPQQEKESFSINVFEAVLLGRRPHMEWRVREKDMTIVQEVLETLGITALADRHLPTLSGGERQKVAIARALAQEPSVLLLDEPTSSLDLCHQLEILDLMQSLAHEKGLTVLMILHDLNLTARYSDRVFLIWNQGIYTSGSPQEVLTPKTIREVYGVQVEVVKTPWGDVFIPLRNSGDSSTNKELPDPTGSSDHSS